MIRLLGLFALLLVCSFNWQSSGIQKGKASYYANKFNGKRTSSGEVFYQDSLTCAHSTLKFGTYLKIKNTANDSIVIVKVNDRLSKSSGRIVDVSLSAAKQLNFVQKGIAIVTIQVVEKN